MLSLSGKISLTQMTERGLPVLHFEGIGHFSIVTYLTTLMNQFDHIVAGIQYTQQIAVE